MRILLWHGYLLSGSGSNIYTREIARRWRAEGHHVVCMCQERHPEGFEWIDHVSQVGPRRRFRPAPGGSGVCELVRPDIGDVLPVYVYDEYEGTTAKRFVDTSADELDTYNRANVEMMSHVVEVFEPEAIVTGHEVMGPYIARHACGGRRFVAKLHGSALEYAVKEDPDRFMPYAMEGLGAAAAVAGGSAYMLEEASRFIPGWRDRGHVVNPGVDVDLFRPIDRPVNAMPVVASVGKLIANKGVHDLLVAVGLLEQPVELVIVGFGDMEGRLRTLADALGRADATAAAACLDPSDPRERAAHDALTGPAGMAIAQAAARSKIRFTGRLEHEPLSRLLPAIDVIVVPSILAEAFGMVAAEAAVCGVVPVVPDHSGIGEVGRTLEAEVGRPGLCTYPVDDRVRGIAERVTELTAIPPDELRELGLRMAAFARQRWSWTRCAGDLLSLATEG